jgi:ligand-binding sensor domain-containing protein
MGNLFEILHPERPADYKEGTLNNDITTILEDKTGKLWVGTRGDAFVYDGKTFTTLTHQGEALSRRLGYNGR